MDDWEVLGGRTVTWHLSSRKKSSSKRLKHRLQRQLGFPLIAKLTPKRLRVKERDCLHHRLSSLVFFLQFRFAGKVQYGVASQLEQIERNYVSYFFLFPSRNLNLHPTMRPPRR